MYTFTNAVNIDKNLLTFHSINNFATYNNVKYCCNHCESKMHFIISEYTSNKHLKEEYNGTKQLFLIICIAYQIPFYCSNFKVGKGLKA